MNPLSMNYHYNLILHFTWPLYILCSHFLCYGTPWHIAACLTCQDLFYFIVIGTANCVNPMVHDIQIWSWLEIRASTILGQFNMLEPAHWIEASHIGVFHAQTFFGGHNQFVLIATSYSFSVPVSCPSSSFPFQFPSHKSFPSLPSLIF